MPEYILECSYPRLVDSSINQDKSLKVVWGAEKRYFYAENDEKAKIWAWTFLQTPVLNFKGQDYCPNLVQFLRILKW